MTLTLQNIPLELGTALRKKAEQQHRTVDEIAVEAMKAGLGLERSEPNTNGTTSLAAAIRNRFGPLGGVELADPIREPMREPMDFGR